MNKKWYKSKTMWFNILTAIVSIATMYGYKENPEVTKNVAIVTGAFAPVVNMLLRKVTNTGIK